MAVAHLFGLVPYKVIRAHLALRGEGLEEDVRYVCGVV